MDSITAERAMVIDQDTGTVLWSRNHQRIGPIASIQKMLAAMLVVQSGDLETLVDIHPEDIACSPANKPALANLRTGDIHTRRSLVEAMLIGSSNDACLALARSHSGSAAAFAEAMTECAGLIGMTHTRLRNPTGLPTEDQYSTAEDVALLAQHAGRIEFLRDVMKCRETRVVHGDGTITCLKNTNRLLFELDGCDGMKTGFTRASGQCLVASVCGGTGQRRIAVALNSGLDAVWNDCRQLLALDNESLF